MKIKELTNEGFGSHIAKGLSAAVGGGVGAVAGVIPSVLVGVIGTMLVGPTVGAVTTGAALALSTALGAWVFAGIPDSVKNEEREIFSVFINGKRIADSLNYRDAAKEILRLAAKEHNPNTYYTILNNETDEIAWRYVKIGRASCRERV